MQQMLGIYFKPKATPEEALKCLSCHKMFAHKSGISRHKKICKGKNVLDALATEVNALKQKNIDLEDKIQKCSGNVIVTNIQNINVFGQETLDHLSDALLDWCVKARNKGHLQLIKSIYLECLANKNIKPCNKPNRYLVHNGETFEYLMQTDVQDAMIDKSQVLLSSHFEKNEARFKKELSQTWVLDIIEYLSKIDRNSSSSDVRVLWALREHIDMVFVRLAEKEGLQNV
jgi:hypothetical protein